MENLLLEKDSRYGSWSGANIERFLIDTAIPMRLSLTTAKGPLIVPLWYAYRDRCLWSCSPQRSVLVRSLKVDPEVAFDISTNDIPYRGVRGRGRMECLTSTGPEELESLLRRYLGNTSNDLARWLLSRADDEAVLKLDVDWLTSWDFTQRMQGAG